MAIKQIRFNEEEEKTLLVHAEKYGRNFSSYVKDLIIRDMEMRVSPDQVLTKEEVRKIISEVIESKNFDTLDKIESIEETESENYGDALRSLMGL